MSNIDATALEDTEDQLVASVYAPFEETLGGFGLLTSPFTSSNSTPDVTLENLTFLKEVLRFPE